MNKFTFDLKSRTLSSVSNYFFMMIMGLLVFSLQSNAQTNPLAPAYGFNIFVQNNVGIGPADVEGGFAAGGNFIFSPSNSGSSSYAGAANAGGVGTAFGTVSGINYAAVIGGSIDWTNSSNSFSFTMPNNTVLAKFGNLNGGTYAASKITNGAKFLQFNSQSQTTQASFVQTGIINFTTQFSTLSSTSSCLSALIDNTPNISGTTYSINLSSAPAVSVLNITGAQLTSLTNFTVTGASSAHILIINVNATSVTIPATLNQNNNSFAPFILWNFYNATSLSIGRLSGSLLAPLADVTKPLSSNNIDGQVIAKSYTQLSGETHIANFNGLVSCPACTKPNAGADQIACSGSSTTLTGTSLATGTWSAQTGNPAGATLGTTTNGVATVSWATTAGGSYNFIYTSGTCTDTARITVLTPVVASGNQNVCTNGVNTYCAVTNANVQYYEWNFGANATPLTSKNSCVDVSWSTAGTKTITLYYISLSGCSTNSVTYTVNVSKPDAGVDKSLTCITLGTGSVTMTATGTGTWSARTTPANPGTSTITNTTLATTTITGFSASGTYGYVWTNGSCTDTVLVNVTAKPVAGADKNLTCITLGSGSVAMTATGTGTWSARTTPANPGTSSITNTTLATTTITGFSATGTYGYVWTNGSCTDTVLVNVTAKPDAGIDKNACVILGSGSVTMTATGTGTWSIRTIPANPGTSAITTATSPTTTITGFSAVGTYGYVWTNGSCTDTVLINITNCSCTKPNAGADQIACSGSSTTLTGTSPTTGTWSAQTGNPAGATLGATTNGVASVSWATAAGGSYNFIYTSGTCTDTTRITVLTPVVASGNQNVCVNSLNTYCAVTNSNVQYYEWNFGTNATPQTSKNSCVDVSWSTAGTKTITLYYISLSGCSTNTITYTVNVSSKASAGTDQAVCGGNSAALTGTNPTTGTWTAQTGNPVGATLGSTTNGNAIVSFTNTASGIFSFIYNATGCPDTTKITVTPKPAAGVDKNACITLGSGSVAMTAVGTGTWTARTSPANPGTSNITTPGSATTTITGFSVVGTYGYVWSSGGCTDTVLINITSCGCTKPNAGTNQVGCSGTTSTLTGTSPTTGTWSAQTGNPAGATVGTTTGGIATITWANTASGNYNFIYTVGTCTDTTKITVLTPVVASGNQNVCVGTPITYCAVTDPNVQYYEWNFGTDASPQTSKNSCVDVTWSTPGTKTITLYYISLSGCSTNTISYTVNVGACCTGKVTSLYFSNGTATVPITNGASFNINTVSGLYYFEAGTSGSIGSIKYTISGPSASSNIENTAPYNSPGTGSGNWSGTEGTYSVNLKTYSAAGATGTICHDTTITFTLNNPACCTNSILTNPSFESGTTGWNFLPANSSTGASDFYTGTGFVMCGSANAFLNAGGTTKSFYQQVNGVAPGTQYTLTIYGGTHQPSLDHSFLLSFYNTSGVRLLKDSVQVDWDVDLAPGLQQYTLQGVAPAGTSYLRVEGKGTGDYIKVDMACLTVTSQPASLGDLVWNDMNGNGMQDPGEPGIAGDTVRLTNIVTNITLTTITNASGRYLFSGLTPGTYKVTFATPSGFTTPSSPNMGGNDNMDSDPGAGGTTGNYTLGSGQSDTTVDAGFYMPVNLGNFVWYDQNNNGVQDVGEPGLAGATVTLYDSTGTTQIGSSITTGADGLYSFTNLTPGNYVVGVTPPAGYKSSAVDGGDPDNNINTDDNGTGSGTTETKSSPISLLSGSEPTTDGDGNNGNLTVDFGFAGTGSIGDYVWNDKDGNGLQGTAVAEPGVAGVIVTLTYTINGTAFTLKDTTDANGLYLFPNLPPATYTVVFSNVPAGMNVTTTDAGANANDNTDSDGLTPPGITLTAGQNNLSIDLGLYTPVNLGNFVWYDQNNNGVQDAGEPGLAGASVQLYAANGTTAIGSPVITTSTGLYNFTNLAPGDYVVGVTPPAGYKSSAVDGGDPDNDINIDDNGTGSGTTETKSSPITLVSGSEPTTDGDGNNGNLTVDFGFTGTGSIGDYVWNDKDGNGLQGTAVAEPGVAGVIVTLTYTINGTAFTVKDTTDANGLYLFPNLPPATYTIVFSNVPAGMNVTTTDAGANANDNTDSDGLTPPGITLTAGQNNLSIDLGLYTPVNLGNFVWYDQNNNGVQDAGEPGLAGASVQLYAANGTTAIGSPVITTSTGLYNFTNLAPGDYVVGVTPPAGYKSSAVDGGDPDNNINTDDNGTGSGTTETKSSPITLVSGSEPTTDGDGNNGNLTVDFGFAGTGSIGDYVWNDKDGNGLQGTAVAEPGVAGVIVTLTYTINGTAFTVKDTTDANGLYLFPNLPPATYTVVFSNVPAGMNVTTTDAGANANDNTDSDGLTPPGITLTAGQNNLSIDLGLYTPVNLGNFVWYDQNNNGVQDAGEPGLAGASVQLYAANGTTAIGSPVITTSTGLYNFTNLAPGDYVVGVTPPAGYKSSALDGGDPDNDINTDDNGTGSGTTETKSSPITLVSGSEPTTDGDGNNGNLTVDFGFAGTGSIGDYVWNDKDGNGLQGTAAAEPGVAGVIVTLTYTINGTAFTVKDTTDANGLYLFPNLPPATYTLVFSNVPAGMNVTTTDAGANANDNTDSDGLTPPGIALTAGQNNLSIDLGLYQPASLGNFVWNDLNANGSQDPGEPGIPNVPVTLTNVTTAATTPTTTGSDGKYLFSNLVPGTYKVTFGTPNGYVATTANAGTTTDALDSDPIGGITGNYTLISGQTDTTVDAGFYLPASIGDFVWYDANGNGTQNLNEPGIPNVNVKLINVNTNAMFTTTTNSSGKYLFSGLAPGTYTLQFTTPTAASGNLYTITRSNTGSDATDSDISPTGQTGNYTLIAGQIDTSVDAGYSMPDLQPTLFFSPASFVVNESTNNTIPINVLCRISEVGRTATNGSNIVVKIPKTIFINFSYNPNLSFNTTDGTTLNNSSWVFSQDATYWIWTYSGVFPARGESFFAFDGTFNTFFATGVYFMLVDIVDGSGGEFNFSNNSDMERVDYFTN